MARDGSNPVYMAWAMAKRRCLNPNHKSYHRYGGRGITMYAGWINDFDAFASYVGERPSPLHSLDRRDNDGNYEPGNVRWATREEQFNNRSDTLQVTYLGVTQSMMQWAKQLGCSHDTLMTRYNKGERGEVLFRPIRAYSRTNRDNPCERKNHTRT